MPQRRKIGKRAVVARLAVGTAALTAAVFGSSGTASAYWSTLVDIRCAGLSPNIVDIPFSAQVVANEPYGQPGASFTVHTGASVWGGYTMNPTLTWTNLATGASGTVSGSAPVSSLFGTGGTVYFNALPTGSGPVRVDVTIVNRGLAPVPPVNCSGTVQVP